MENLWHDFKFALRTLAKNPGFAAVATLTLALGIGASTTIYSVVDAVLLTPLPYEEPERLVMLRESSTSPMIPMSAREFLHLEETAKTETAKTLAGVAALDLVDFNVVWDSGAERTTGAMVSADFFELFGVYPALGRGFADDEEEPGRNRVVLLSHRFWQERFGGDPDVVGRELRALWSASFGPARELGESLTVIGVLPREYISPMGPRDLWVPLALSAANVEGAAHYLFPFARLAPGVDIDSAQAELSEIQRASALSADQAPGHRGEVGVTVTSLSQRAVGRVRPALLAISGAVIFVLLIASANVANLLLARASVREREIALRLSLGASRGRLVSQLLVESLVLASLGAALGLLLAHGGVAALKALQPLALPRITEIAIDGRVLAMTAALTLATAFVFGLAPALSASRFSFSRNLRDAAGDGLGAGSRLRRTLVVAEIALSVVLLVGAGLLVRSFGSLLDVDLGFEPEHVLTFQVALPQLAYPDSEARQVFYSEAVEELEALPEVVSAAAVNSLPLSFLNTAGRLAIEGRPAEDGEVRAVSYRMVSAAYFETLGISVLRGEGFRAQDVRRRPEVAIVNQALVRRDWDGEDPIGSIITIPTLGPTQMRVVGVVADVHQRGPASPPRPTVYLPSVGFPRAMSFAVRGRGEPEALSEAARRVIRSLDPEQPIHNVAAMSQAGSAWLSRPKFNAFLSTLFAGLALALAAVGIYGVLNFSVSRRTREMGIRQALGARRGDVLRLVVGQGMRLVWAGLALGLVASFGLTRFLDSLLFGVEATDPATFVAISGLLVVVALAAVYVPARRATWVEPVTALRHE